MGVAAPQYLKAIYCTRGETRSLVIRDNLDYLGLRASYGIDDLSASRSPGTRRIAAPVRC